MNRQEILIEVEATIAGLQQARYLLAGGHGKAASANGKVRRPMSAQGRANIVAAQKKRWAELKKAMKR